MGNGTPQVHSKFVRRALVEKNGDIQELHSITLRNVGSAPFRFVEHAPWVTFSATDSRADYVTAYDSDEDKQWLAARQGHEFVVGTQPFVDLNPGEVRSFGVHIHRRSCVQSSHNIIHFSDPFLFSSPGVPAHVVRNEYRAVVIFPERTGGWTVTTPTPDPEITSRTVTWDFAHDPLGPKQLYATAQAPASDVSMLLYDDVMAELDIFIGRLLCDHSFDDGRLLRKIHLAAQEHDFIKDATSRLLHISQLEWGERLCQLNAVRSELAESRATFSRIAGHTRQPISNGFAQPSRQEAMLSNKTVIPSFDVLILTALKDELDAVLQSAKGGSASWSMSRDSKSCRYFHVSMNNERGGTLRVAAAWAGDMGPQQALMRAQHLIEELKPSCIAMCGICAGDREKVALGDVVIADQLYFYDHGKNDQSEFLHSIKTFDLPMDWKMDAAFLPAELDLSFAKNRPLSRRFQRRWLLWTLLDEEQKRGMAPDTHSERNSKCPKWSKVLADAKKAGLVDISDGRILLTDQGRQEAQLDKLLHPDGLPEDPAFRIHTGAIAAGSSVQKDRTIFGKLQRIIRTTLALEMEGPAIAQAALHFGIRCIVIKAVTDHADEEKDDDIREFACEASARVLLAFLLKHVEPAFAQALAQPARSSAPTPPPPTDLVADEAREHSELVKQLGTRLGAFKAARERLTDTRFMGICKYAPSKLIENWLAAMDKHPRDKPAVASLMARLWKEALDLQLVPPLTALDRRIDLETLAQIYVDKKASWGVLETEQSKLIGPRAFGRKAVLGWKYGAWESQHKLAGPLFEWVWDVLRANHDEKVPFNKFYVRWWGAGGGVLRFDVDIVFPWPVADLVYFLNYEDVAAVWNEKYERAMHLLQNLPDEQSIVDDLAFWFVEAQHQLWPGHASGSDGELYYISERNWKKAVAHLLEWAKIDEQRNNASAFSEWAQAVPLFAAPESGLSDEAAAAILDGANLDETSRVLLRELRLKRARHSAPGQDAEAVIAKIDEQFAGHPWVVRFNGV